MKKLLILIALFFFAGCSKPKTYCWQCTKSTYSAIIHSLELQITKTESTVCDKTQDAIDIYELQNKGSVTGAPGSNFGSSWIMSCVKK